MTSDDRNQIDGKLQEYWEDCSFLGVLDRKFCFPNEGFGLRGLQKRFRTDLTTNQQYENSHFHPRKFLSFSVM